MNKKKADRNPLQSRRFHAPAITSVAALLLTLAGCGGGGGGEAAAPPLPPADGGGDDVTPRPPPPEPSPTPNAGIASYGSLTAVAPTASAPRRYSVQIGLAAFDAVTYQTAQITALSTSVTSLAVPGSSATLGEQRYSLQSLSCTSASAQNPYRALMLFDRSGSMAGNDPNDDTLAAAREFVDRMGPEGRALVGAFPGGSGGRPTSPATFYGADFTNDQGSLLAAIASVGPPEGSTPLWDSMSAAIALLRPTSRPGSPILFPDAEVAVLLTFSDGEDTTSTNASSITVDSLARQRQVKVFAVNLRNSDSQLLDAIALSSGGRVYSTDDATSLLAFYGTLGKLLAGTAENCMATIDIEFVPAAGFEDVAYGAGATVKVPLEFDAVSGTSDVLVETQILLPFYPGRRIGQTSFGGSVYETDFGSWDDNVDCVEISGGRARNACNAPIWLAICDANQGAVCQRGPLQPDESFAAYASNRYAQCLWEEPYQRYESVQVSGTAPNQTFAPWQAGPYACVNTMRAPF